MAAIKINNLHYISEPTLLFMANDIVNKGRSNKTYTIQFVNDQHNDEALNQLFSSRAKRTVKFEAVYSVDGIDMQGWLIINSVNRRIAEGVFVSGNGRLWEAMSNMKLADYDWSAYDHDLSLANVQSSETNGDYIYDICDRGAFLSEVVYEEKASRYDPGTGGISSLASIDITERYPAISIKTIFETVLHQEGFGVTWSENVYNSDLEDLYLLYTQDNAIRNDKEWEKSAIFEASGDGESHTYSSTEPAFLIERTLKFPDEAFDLGGNFTGTSSETAGSNIYTVPETGTYRFRASLSLQFTVTSGSITSESFDVGLRIGSNWLYQRSFTTADFSSGRILNVDIDTKPTEFEKDDTIKAVVRWAGDKVSDYSLLIAQNTALFFCQVSRYYGAGSTVSLGALMPDMKASDFFSKVAKYLNLYTFYREETRILEIQHGRQMKAIATSITPVDEGEELTEPTNYWLTYKTDKAQPPVDDYIDNNTENEETISFDFSRTLISDCVRVFASTSPLIPVLWESGDPLSWSDVVTPPDWETKAALRIVRYDGQGNGSYTLTYGGDYTDNDSSETDYPMLREPDVVAFHEFELIIMEGTGLELITRIDISKLYDQTYFKSPLWIDGFGIYWLDSAEKQRDNIYKLKLIK